MKKTIIFLCLFILDLILMLLGVLEPFDDFIYKTIISLKSSTLTSIFKAFTFLGSTKFVLTMNIIIFIIAIISKKYKLTIINACSILSVIVNNLLKIIIRRSRPIGINLIEESFYSFPSGHAMISILFYGSIIYLLNKSNFKYKNIAIIGLIFIICMICLSRIYLGVHFASDIMGGVLAGLIIRQLVINLYERKIK